MIQIRCEGTEFEYLPADTSGGEEFPEAGLRLDGETTERLKNGPDTRLALFRNLLQPHQWIPYWLVWQSPPNLLALDERVRAGTYDASDFKASLRAVAQLTRCFSCGANFRTLIIDAGDPYPGAPNLLREKITRLRILPYPQCGSSLRQLVAKILDD